MGWRARHVRIRHRWRVASDRGDDYLEAFAAVRSVVNDIDPIGLAMMGAPEDEYDPEVTDLVRLVMRPAKFGEADVDAIWRRWFGDDYAAMHRVESLSEQTLALRRLQEQYGAPRQP